ncbi:protein phosphatase CheZ [Cognatazoarcus halotolerans]|uniref:protein phosphatase CheZ n=1 Tax=Cognatazoarcus halotolerans TaxID=2686016 RepID=UPI001357FE94|nr:protein phosphatase CheZ [Cognatazoarcus halotolerans]MCB1900131.1 protein phosphatase CheZ [Rhodocyclaceae bacterium]MCP5311314.1 protein phosphatase CheZ [Zoogloeaceae bacterium]
MAKRLKFDESGDSDDLQALFDSIASSPVKPRLEVINDVTASGDDDELQSLFDSVAAEFGDMPAAGEDQAGGAEALASAESLDHAHAPEQVGDAVFNRIGHMTRQLHDTLRELGYDQALQQAAESIPDARQRLLYISQMTEQAASRVLNATDIAKPIQERIEARAGALHARWESVFANKLSADDFKTLAVETRTFLGETVKDSRATNSQLTEIMMAQDFQDLTGQVIKRVIDLAQRLESQLLQVLIESMPAERKGEKSSSLMNGPVINAAGRDDVVSSQEQVDDLLESLGF